VDVKYYSVSYSCYVKKKPALARQYFLKQSGNTEAQNAFSLVYLDEGQYANEDQFTAIHTHNF